MIPFRTRRRVFQNSSHDRSATPAPGPPPCLAGSSGRGRVPAGLALVGFVGLCLLVGAAGGAVTAPAIRGWYLSLARPPGVPPDFVFGPVWTTLYVLMGVAAWLVWRRLGLGEARAALRLWGWQLAVNALWSPVFFALHSLGGALAVILVLLGLIVLTWRAFLRVRPVAGWLLLPYLAWVCYATYLNAGFWWLNRG